MKQSLVPNATAINRLSRENEFLKKQLERENLRRELEERQKAREVPIESVHKYGGDYLDVKDEDRDEVERALGMERPDSERLGEWAERRLEEIKKFSRLVRSSQLPEKLRTQFPTLFAEVIDKLRDHRRKQLFNDAQAQRMKVPDLLEFVAEVKNLRESYLQDLRKKYRSKAGIARKRR